MIEIRREQADDIDAIRGVNRAAFQQDQEGRIVDALRANGAALLSLVALVDGEVVGHVMYSPASIDAIAGAALGPMAVAPEHQRRGIGTRLVQAGNAILADSDCPFVIVIGHPEFYPRFGFVPASGRGISCEWDVPPEAFMVRFLSDAHEDLSGMAKYRQEFSDIS